MPGMSSLRLTAASVAIATLAAVFFLKAPLLPVLVGALGAGALLAYRDRRS